MKRTLNSKFLIASIFMVGVLIRIFYSMNGLIEFGGGDSSARALITIRYFSIGYEWFVSSIWLPFYFLLYGFALKVDYSSTSLLLFQLFISINTLFLFYKIIQKQYDHVTQVITMVFIVLLPVQLGMVSSVLSELPLLLFTLAGVCSYEKSTKLSLIISIICFLAASMIRFEGWFFYIGFVLYDYFKNQSLKRVLFILLPFVLIIGIYEYKQYIHTDILFAGLTTNEAPSRFVNIRNGYGELGGRLLEILKILFRQSGLLFLFVPVGLFLKLKKREIYLMDTVFIINTGLLLFGSMMNSIAIFPRYWLVPISLGLPLAAIGLQVIKNIYLKMTILIISIILINPLQFHVLYPRSILGTKEMAKIIESQKEIKKAYIDDIDHQYIFTSIQMYLKFRKSSVHIQHRNEKKYIEQAPNMEEVFSLAKSRYYSKRLVEDDFDAIVLVKDSYLYRLLIIKYRSRVLREYARVNDLVLYKVSR